MKRTLTIFAALISTNAIAAPTLQTLEQATKANQANINTVASSIGQLGDKVKYLGEDNKATRAVASHADISAANANAAAATAKKIGQSAQTAAGAASATAVKAQGSANIANLKADKLDREKANAYEVNVWLETKVDNDTYANDQAAQNVAIQNVENSVAGTQQSVAVVDGAQKAESVERIKNDAAAQDKISALYDVKADKNDVGELRNAQAVEASERTKNDAVAQDKINDLYDVKADKRVLDEVNTTAIAGNNAAARAQDSADTANAGVAELDAKKANRAQVTDLSQVVETKASHGEVQRVSDETSRTYADKAVATANAYTDQRVADVSANQSALKHQQDKDRREARAGVAAAAAMANIPTAREVGRMSLGLGAGFYKDASALAIGASYRTDNHFTLKGSVSSTGVDTVVGAGVSYEL